MIDTKKLQSYLDENRDLLEPVSYDFASRMYAGGLEKYDRRLRQVGFHKCKAVLDAGSGTGQWSLALSQMCDQVTATDILEGRVYMLDGLVKTAGVKNVKVEYGSLKKLKYADASFDGIICYGVIFTTGDWQTTLKEMSRVLRPGGLIYVTGNGPGYYRQIWSEQPNKMEGHDPRKWAALAFYNTWRIDQGLDGLEVPLQIIPPDDMVKELETLGFENVVRTGEGQYKDPTYDGPTEKPFFKAEYMGDVCVYEVVGMKRAK